MTICRYFAQGTCRFGDRCRFEHIIDNYNYNQRSYSNNQWNTRNYEKQQGYSNYNRYDNEYRNQRYEPRNYRDEYYRNYSPDRYTEYSPYSNYNNQQYGYRQGYEQQTRTYEGNYGKTHLQYYDRENENVYGQNRFRWLSDDYKNQTHVNVQHSNYEHGNNSYTTSTPKGKPTFSFKVPESEVKKGSNTFFQVDEQDQFFADNVKEDAKSWELGGQWPFTCYFPQTNKCAFPGFYDVSPEELRFAAYKAKKSDSYKVYLQSVQNALTQVNEQRSQLQIATPQLLSTLRKIRNGEDIYSTSKMIDPIVSIHSSDTVVENMETPDIFVTANSVAASFSFKMPTETDSAVNTTASSFSFKLPASTEIKVISNTVSDGDINIYTPLGNLTEEEKEQFSASTFVLGKIPTKPPSLAFCT